MKIVTAGMYRSGTTYQFNALRLILEEVYGKDNVNACGVYDYIHDPDKINLIKIHRLTRKEKRKILGYDYLFTTQRNDEDIKNSIQKFKPELMNVYDTSIISANWFKDNANYIQYFSDINTISLVNDYIEVLKVDVDPYVIIKRLRELKPPKFGYDSETMLYYNHITK